MNALWKLTPYENYRPIEIIIPLIYLFIYLRIFTLDKRTLQQLQQIDKLLLTCVQQYKI